MDVVFLALHVLAASVWVGGTIILVFVAVPYARTLPGETRGQALRALGRGWRLFGWGAMAVSVFTGVQLAIADGAFDDAESDFDAVLVVKIVAVAPPHRRRDPPRLRPRATARPPDPRAAPADDSPAARRRRLDEPRAHADGPGTRRGAGPFIVGGCNRTRARWCTRSSAKPRASRSTASPACWGASSSARASRSATAIRATRISCSASCSPTRRSRSGAARAARTCWRSSSGPSIRSRSRNRSAPTTRCSSARSRISCSTTSRARARGSRRWSAATTASSRTRTRSSRSSSSSGSCRSRARA